MAAKKKAKSKMPKMPTFLMTKEPKGEKAAFTAKKKK